MSASVPYACATVPKGTKSQPATSRALSFSLQKATHLSFFVNSHFPVANDCEHSTAPTPMTLEHLLNYPFSKASEFCPNRRTSNMSERPVGDGSGYSDIWKGTFEGKWPVAIKVLRSFGGSVIEEKARKFFRVGFHFYVKRLKTMLLTPPACIEGISGFIFA